MKSVGVNLYSLRTLIKTEDGLANTLSALAKMGYNSVQFSGAPFDAAMIKRVSERTGVPIVLTHVPLADILDRTEALMEEHASFGCRSIGLGSLPSEMIPDEKAIKGVIAKLGEAAENMKNAGFSLYYHNHHHDCYKHGGVTLLDYMIETCPDLNFTLDTYWLQYGGMSVTDYIRRLSGRISFVHLKDYKITVDEGEGGKRIFKPVFAPVGDGNLDFASYYPLMEASGVEHYLVEQDNAVCFDDPLGEVERSIRYIRRHLTL